ncbi:MAG: hypothetical protein CMF51_04780 [Legionellales bacterium]|nr:hypothetical protein [Legionellales bacterium]
MSKIKFNNVSVAKAKGSGGGGVGSGSSGSTGSAPTKLSTCRALQETGVIDYSEYINRDDPSEFKDGDLTKFTTSVLATRGVKCPCSDTVWETKGSLRQHIQSIKHKRWLRQITAEMSDPIRVRQDAEKEKRHLRELNQKADYRIRALEKQLREARCEITNEMQSVEALTEELDTYKQATDTLCTKLEEITVERDYLREAHEWEKKKVGGLRLRLSEFENWLKKGAAEIMEWEIPESDDEL